MCHLRHDLVQVRQVHNWHISFGFDHLNFNSKLLLRGRRGIQTTIPFSCHIQLGDMGHVQCLIRVWKQPLALIMTVLYQYNTMGRICQEVITVCSPSPAHA